MIRCLFTFLIYVIIISPLYPQRADAGDPSNCIFRTMEDYLDDVCDTSDKPYVDKVFDRGGRVKKYILKTRRDNKKLKKAFAALIDGELYIQIYPITRNLAKKDRLPSSRYTSDFLKVLSWGVYDYLEYDGDSYNRSGSGIGIGGGGVSTGIGLGLSLGGGGGDRIQGMIFDPDNQEFNVFRNCKDFNEFLLERHPEFSYECKKKKIKLNQIRSIIGQINGVQSPANDVDVDEENSKLITIFPHRSIVKHPCTLLIAGEEWEFDDLTVLDTRVACDEVINICVNGTEVCVEASCEDDVVYYLVSRDRETDTFSVEPSDADEHKYYTALLERRKKRGK